jgi:hypothetical protein
MGEFMKFCKDFEIKLSKQKVAEVFKKCATNSITMNLGQFKASLAKMFSEIAKEEIESLKKR